MPRRKVISTAILIFLILLVFSFIPFERTIVPPWRFQVIDETGTPIKNTAVCQIWRHYSAEAEYHREDSMTDQNGFVEFPKRTLNVGYFRIVIGAINEFRKLSIYASFGPFSKILVLSNKNYIYAASYKKDGNLQDRIVVPRFQPVRE